MKKITFFILFLTVAWSYSQLPEVRNFVVTANPNISYSWGNRFDFQFDIRGEYGYGEIRLWLYKGQKSSKPTTNSDFIAYSRWNRESDNYLNFPNYTLRPWWNSWSNGSTSSPPYSIQGKSFTLIVEYQGIRRFLYYTVPNPDSDGDGVPNVQDQCPNEAGPSSNNGCPGSPDLEIDKNNTIIFSSDCSIFNCDPNLSRLGSARHRLNTSSSSIQFNNIRVKNLGNANSVSSNIAFYISQNTTFNASDDLRLSKTVSLGTINKNGYRDVSITLARFDFPSTTTGNFYLLLVVDDSKSNSESNETNNVVSVGMNISSSAKLNAKLSNVFVKENQSYPMEILDFQGNRILIKEVRSLEEENSVLDGLPKNLYIVKSQDESRKVFTGQN